MIVNAISANSIILFEMELCAKLSTQLRME